MMHVHRFVVVSILAVFAAAAMPARAQQPLIPIHDRETVVVMGDSITFMRLVGRFHRELSPDAIPPEERARLHLRLRRLHSAARGRFPTRRGALKPTLVFVNFGMNDGRYLPPDGQRLKQYLDDERRLVGLVARLWRGPCWSPAPASMRSAAAQGGLQ